MRLSVIIPTYNRAHLVTRAIESVLRELAAGDEVIVVDDGSKDAAAATVRAISDPRVRYIEQEHAGAGAARNLGTREANGDLIAFLDSDDEWLPGRVAVQSRFMIARPDILFSFTDLARDFDGRHLFFSRGNWHTDPRGWDEILGAPVPYSSIAQLPPGVADFSVFTGNIYRGEMLTNYLSTISVMIRRADAGDAIHFTEGIPAFEDWECFGRLAQRGETAYLDFLGALQNSHTGPRLTDVDGAAKAESRLVVLKNVWGSDPEFLQHHGEEYRAFVYAQQLVRVRSLLSLGRPGKARDAMRGIDGIPMLYRVLASLPAVAVSVMVGLGRLIRDGLKRLRTEVTA
jgi:glycosyltransferase involved in cell wall biosynthesis